MAVSFHIMDAATKTPKKAKSIKTDTADYLQHIQYVKSPNAATNPIVRACFTVVAHFVIAVFATITVLRRYLRQLYYIVARQTLFRNRTPQLVRQDVSNFPKIPSHIAFVLNFRRGPGDIDTLIEHSVECLSWIVGIGAPKITLYERTGVLKTLPLDQVGEALATGLSRYITNSDMPYIVVRSGTEVSGYGMEQGDNVVTVTLASEQDGRPMLVALANEYRQEVASGKLKPEEITVDKVHEVVLERVGEEPDLLVTFGSYLDMERFSPWLLRVTELFCLPDNNGVFHYMVLYRALQKFANVKVNLGA